MYHPTPLPHTVRPTFQPDADSGGGGGQDTSSQSSNSGDDSGATTTVILIVLGAIVLITAGIGVTVVQGREHPAAR